MASFQGAGVESKTLGQAIGAVVTQLRVERKWSQGKLGAKAGYSTAWLNKLENGKANPTFHPATRKPRVPGTPAGTGDRPRRQL